MEDFQLQKHGKVTFVQTGQV